MSNFSCLCNARGWASGYETVCMKPNLEDGGLCKAHQKKLDLKQLHFGTMDQERPTIWGELEGESVGLVDSLKVKEGKNIPWKNEDPIEDVDDFRNRSQRGEKPWGTGERPNKRKSSPTKKTGKKSSGYDKIKDLEQKVFKAREGLQEARENLQQVEAEFKQAREQWAKQDVVDDGDHWTTGASKIEHWDPEAEDMAVFFVENKALDGGRVAWEGDYDTVVGRWNWEKQEIIFKEAKEPTKAQVVTYDSKGTERKANPTSVEYIDGKTYHITPANEVILEGDDDMKVLGCWMDKTEEIEFYEDEV